MKRLRDAMWRYQKGYFRVYSSWNSLSLLQNSITVRPDLSLPFDE